MDILERQRIGEQFRDEDQGRSWMRSFLGREKDGL